MKCVRFIREDKWIIFMELIWLIRWNNWCKIHVYAFWKFEFFFASNVLKKYKSWPTFPSWSVTVNPYFPFSEWRLTHFLLLLRDSQFPHAAWQLTQFSFLLRPSNILNREFNIFKQYIKTGNSLSPVSGWQSLPPSPPPSRSWCRR